MQYSLLSQNISIVVLGKFNPEFLNPIWMVKNNILSVDDLRYGITSSSDTLNFKTQKFEVLITYERMQVVCFDISDSDLMSDFVIKILECKNNEELSAVGINSQKIFSLLNDPDMLKFCHHFAPLNALTPISDNALMCNMDWQSWEEPQSETSPRKQISLKRVVYGDKYPSFSMSVNNHYNVCSSKEAINVIENVADALYFMFNDQFEEMMKSI